MAAPTPRRRSVRTGRSTRGSDAKRLFAIDPAGKVRWKLELQGEADTAILLVGGNDLVVAAGPHVYRVHPDGTVVWRFDAGRKVFTAPARTAKDGLVFGAQDHNAYGVGADGKLVFKVDLGADVDGSPVVNEDGTAFFGTDGPDGGAIAAIAAGGELRWKTKLPGYVRGALSLARNGDVLGGMYGPTPAVIRLAPDGHPVGRFAVAGTGAKEFGVHGAPLEDETGALFFGAEGRPRLRGGLGRDADVDGGPRGRRGRAAHVAGAERSRGGVRRRDGGAVPESP